MQAAEIIKSFSPKGHTRFVVVLDTDAAEIMGETKYRYTFDNRAGAERFAAVLPSNLDASFADAVSA